jgi:N-acetylmuramoyl-L-alanine amidase
MKLVMMFSVVWAALFPLSIHGSLNKLEHFSISGIDHVRVEDWARLNNFQAKWSIPKQELKLVGPSSSLTFTVDSARMSLNGVHVWLSAPIALRNGSAWISWLDILTSVEPLSTRGTGSSGRVIKRIVLDPGHGGKDPGFREGRQPEKKYTLLLAKEVSDLLNRAGLEASLTRTTDTFLELSSRPDLARRRGADLFISLHFNSAEGLPSGGGVRGIEVYCMTPAHASSSNSRGEGAGAGQYPGNRFDAKNILLGYQLQKAMMRLLPTEDRGVRRARYAVLRSAEMPAVLIEGGFMSNPAEVKKISDPAYRRQMAQAIVEGVKAYKNLLEK